MSEMSLRQVLEQAMAHQRAGRLAEAEKIYRHVLAQHPREANSLHLLGVMAYQRGQLNESLNLIQQAVEIDPKAPVMRGNLAQVLAKLERIEPALEQFRAAPQLRQDMP